MADNGKQFVSPMIEELFSSLGITHSNTALYPQAIYAVECYNRFLTNQLLLGRVENLSVNKTIFIVLAVNR